MVWLCKTKLWWKSKNGYRQFIIYIKSDFIYKDIAKDVETKFDTSNYESDRPLAKENKMKSNWINER